MPNASDVGMARLLDRAGFEAIATSSAGLAFTLGLSDGEVSREQTLRHIAEMVGATSLPVSADLGNGFGAEPETIAETIRLAADAGAVGGSIEDATGDPAEPLFPISLAKERIIAAVEAVRSFPVHFILTARADNFLVGSPSLDDALQRLEAYREAGADVLFAPGLPDEIAVKAALSVAGKTPLNMLASASGIASDLEALAGLGVRRVSLGSGLTRVALTAVDRAIEELWHGRLGFLHQVIPLSAANVLFRGPGPVLDGAQQSVGQQSLG